MSGYFSPERALGRALGEVVRRQSRIGLDGIRPEFVENSAWLGAKTYLSTLDTERTEDGLITTIVLVTPLEQEAEADDVAA